MFGLVQTVWSSCVANPFTQNTVTRIFCNWLHVHCLGRYTNRITRSLYTQLPSTVSAQQLGRRLMIEPLVIVTDKKGESCMAWPMIYLSTSYVHIHRPT